MGYTDVDKLAINTIRVLAVSPVLSTLRSSVQLCPALCYPRPRFRSEICPAIVMAAVSP